MGLTSKIPFPMAATAAGIVTLIWEILSLIFISVFVGIFAVYALPFCAFRQMPSEPNYFGDPVDICNEFVGPVWAGLLTLLFMTLAEIVFAILLIVAVYKDNKCLMISYIVYTAIMTFSFIIIVIIGSVNAPGGARVAAPPILISLIFSIIPIYFMIAVYNHFKGFNVAKAQEFVMAQQQQVAPIHAYT